LWYDIDKINYEKGSVKKWASVYKSKDRRKDD